LRYLFQYGVCRKPDFYYPQKANDNEMWMGWKPKGIWLSADACSINWKEWCIAEEFRLDCLRYNHAIELHPDKILWIRTPQALQEFSREYSFTSDVLRNAGIRERPDSVHWGLLSEKYMGIVIAPYFWEHRLSLDLFWYYSWDCASGCVWDSRAIRNIGPPILTAELIKEKTDA
jgi:hypothetical protein